MKFTKAALMSACIAILVGCATVQPLRSAFNDDEFKPYEGTGTSTITGQAFMKTVGGDVKFGAGESIVLLPVTSYTTELRKRSTIGGERLGPIDGRLEKYRRTTRADGNGNFEFKNLPQGEYYVSCAIFWQVPGGLILEETGGIAYGQAKVGPGETTKVVVTR